MTHGALKGSLPLPSFVRVGHTVHKTYFNARRPLKLSSSSSSSRTRSSPLTTSSVHNFSPESTSPTNSQKMAKHDQNRAVRVYHGIVAILILLAGGALLGVGIWLRVTDNGGPLDLEYSGDSFFNYVLNAGIASIVVGSFLMITAIVSLLALGKKCVGVTFRIIYAILALVILAVLVFICVSAILIRVKGDSEPVRDFIEDAWKLTVTNDPSEICSIEDNLDCRGFSNNDCVGFVDSTSPNADVCASCNVGRDPSVGCYNRIIDSINKIFLPIAIVSGVLSGVVLLDILFLCCL